MTRLTEVPVDGASFLLPHDTSVVEATPAELEDARRREIEFLMQARPGQGPRREAGHHHRCSAAVHRRT